MVTDVLIILGNYLCADICQIYLSTQLRINHLIFLDIGGHLIIASLTSMCK